MIAAAINRYITIKGSPTTTTGQPPSFTINMPNLPNSPSTSIQLPKNAQLLPYEEKRDYLKSGINVGLKQGLKWGDSWNVELTGNIPINAGASSSSAMVIAWMLFLHQTNDAKIEPRLLGELGYNAEVAEFNEAGGMMDHFASAFGNIVEVTSRPSFQATYLPGQLTGFVLANSGKKKDTVDDLKRVKSRALEGFKILEEIIPNFDRFTTPLEEVSQHLSSLKEPLRKVAEGNLINRDITQQALQFFIDLGDNVPTPDQQKKLGALLAHHHKILSQNIGVSISIIDKMEEIAREAGGLGGKINGSGFGGTMFSYAPDKQDEVVVALTDAGYDAWAIDVSEGAKVL